MDNKLTQDYKDNLYEKVLEKKARRTANRKRLASICVVFFIVACFATYGYTKYEKENYNNYFLTESENIYIDDEYEYFDDLGIKLEFINTDKDSITIGVNIKYENIADYRVYIEQIELENIENEKKYENYIVSKKFNSKDEMEYIIKYKLDEDEMLDIKIFKIRNIILQNEKSDYINKNVEFIKKISIED